LFEIQGVELG